MALTACECGKSPNGLTDKGILIVNDKKNVKEDKFLSRVKKITATGAKPENTTYIGDGKKERVIITVEKDGYVLWFTLVGFVEGNTFVYDTESYRFGFNNGRDEANITLGVSAGVDAFHGELTGRAIQDGRDHVLKFRARTNLPSGGREAWVVIGCKFDRFGKDPYGERVHYFRWGGGVI